MEPLVSLIFSGKLTPAVPAGEAKQNLVKLLKLEPGKVDGLFSGRRAVLKRDLSPADAARYIAHLARLGIHVDAEAQGATVAAEPATLISADAGAVSPAAATAAVVPPAVSPDRAGSPVSPAAAGLALAPVVDEIVCPKCGERQPKRTLCLACATDMPRFLAAQEELQRERRQEKLAVTTSAVGGMGVVKDDDDLVDAPSLFGWGFEGRIGRLSYLMGGSLLFAALIWALALAAKIPSLVLFFLSLLPFLVFSVRLGVLRCHDVGWSGWLMLLNLIPYVGSLFSLLLLVLPGNKRDEYGGAPRPASGFATLAALAGAAISVGVATSIIGGELNSLAETGFGRHAARSVPVEAPGDYAATDRVTMYSLTTCGFCIEKRRELNAEGIPFREVFLDEDEAAGKEMMQKLAAQNYSASSVGTPTLEVNGVMLPNNPDMAEIRRHLR